jgi:hypothetical protein
MTVTPAALVPGPAGGTPFVPGVVHDRTMSAPNDYVEEEWFASGIDGDARAYDTQLYVRRPRDVQRFSGTVIVEPLHMSAIAPIFLYCAPYAMRSGHGWVVAASQKRPLDEHVKAFDPARYESLQIETDPAFSAPPAHDVWASDDERAAFWTYLRHHNAASSVILAQIGAALRFGGPFAGYGVRNVLLAGHSQTGFATTNYIADAHESQRLGDGRAVYDGYFPTGYPTTPFGPRDVPLVQVISDGDVSDPDRTFSRDYRHRQYRRDDNDAADDRYRLYELAGVPHMGTRYPPFNSVALWASMADHGAYPEGAAMNSLPHNELFSMALDHLVHWVADRTTPPRAPRIATHPDGRFERDEHGNTVGGVRCAQLDVPRATYLANTPNADGSPGIGTVGIESPFDAVVMEQLYGTHDKYVEQFRARLDELVRDGWMLADDVDVMLAEAAGVQWDDA